MGSPYDGVPVRDERCNPVDFVGYPQILRSRGQMAAIRAPAVASRTTPVAHPAHRGIGRVPVSRTTHDSTLTSTRWRRSEGSRQIEAARHVPAMVAAARATAVYRRRAG